MRIGSVRILREIYRIAGKEEFKKLIYNYFLETKDEYVDRYKRIAFCAMACAEGRTLRSVGKELGLSGERVHQITFHAVCRLNHHDIWCRNIIERLEEQN